MGKLSSSKRGTSKKAWIITACVFITLAAVFVAMFFLVQKPKIEIIGNKDITIPVFDSYNDEGAFVTINNSLQDGLIVENNVKTDAVGNYTVVYKYTVGGKTYSATRNVHIVDNIAPEITLNGAAEITISDFSLYKEEGAAASDNYDIDVPNKIEITSTQCQDGNYEINYFVKDISGNSAFVTRKVIIKDIISPIISLKGNKTVVLMVGDTYKESGFTATDDLDGNITSRVRIIGSVNTAIRGSNYITYSVTDKAGNSASVTRKVSVYSAEDVAANRICLTFDDGPSSDVTVRILDTLKANNVRATFFICNYSADKLPIIKRMINEGHAIGIHGYSHVYADIYQSEEAFMNNIYSLRDKLKNDTGYVSDIIRFPGGSSNSVSSFNKGIMTRLTKLVTEAGFRYFDWNVSSGDAEGKTASKTQIYNTVISGLQHGRTNIVLMHDYSTKSTTADALQSIIDYGKANGYSFSEINDLTPDVHHGVRN